MDAAQKGTRMRCGLANYNLRAQMEDWMRQTLADIRQS
jgi:hypothetical protein